MLNQKLLLSGVLLAAAAAGIGAQSAHATVFASDSAANYSGSFNGSNFGSGFGAWNVNYTYTGAAGQGGGGGSFVGTNAGIPAPTGTTTTTPAFDIYVYPGTGGDTGLNTDITTATRSFSSALAAGQTFTTDLSLDNGNTSTTVANTNPSTADSNMGFALLDSSGKVLFSMICFGGGEYWASDGSNSGAYFEPDSGNILYNYHLDDTFAFNLLNSAGNYSLTAAGSIGGGSPTTFTGSINMAGGGPTQVQYIDNNGGNGSDVQFSSMSIASTPVPEPAMLGLMAISAGAILMTKRRARVGKQA